MTVADVGKLVDLMVTHGVTSIKVGEVHLERPVPMKDRPPVEEQSDWERFNSMSTDQQEKLLRLQRLGEQR